MTPTITIKFDDPKCFPTAAHAGEWYDLSTVEEVCMSAGDFEYIDLGVCIKLPKGYEAILAPRSSTFAKYGIIQTNGIGVIDERYCGDEDKWKFPAYALRPTHIDKGTRIAQFRIQPIQPECNFALVSSMGEKNRGGLGSTGN